MTFLVYVNGSRYAVEEADIEAVGAQILGAVRGGGAFVELRHGAEHPVRVLVTPASAVRIEKVSPPVAPSDLDHASPDYAHFDLDDL